jgi:hypothetical protein
VKKVIIHVRDKDGIRHSMGVPPEVARQMYALAELDPAPVSIHVSKDEGEYIVNADEPAREITVRLTASEYEILLTRFIWDDGAIPEKAESHGCGKAISILNRIEAAWKAADPAASTQAPYIRGSSFSCPKCLHQFVARVAIEADEVVALERKVLELQRELRIRKAQQPYHQGEVVTQAAFNALLALAYKEDSS